MLVGNAVSVGSTSNFTQGVRCFRHTDMVRALVHRGGTRCDSLFHARHVSVTEIQRQLVEVYGEEMMSRQSMEKWCSDFKSCLWDNR